jgi:hypothetical protein
MILPITMVTVEGAQSNPNRDLGNAVTIYSTECGVWVELISAIQVDEPALLVLTQNDCAAAGHVVSAEEDQLFDLGRGLGTDIVGYYIQGDVAGFRGCAAHPPDRRGFWVGDSATQWTLAHELTHVVGDNRHVSDSDNLMFTPTSGITNPPPDINPDQRARILNDPALLCIPSVVLNL